MKTKITMFRNLIKHLFIGLIVVGIQSCETEIPPEDPTPPEFSFRIYGAGFDHTFTEETDFDNIILKLERSTNYKFIYFGSDQGGVDRVQWDILPGKISISSNIPAPWINSYTNGNQNIRWNGDRTNPQTGAAFDGSFYAPYDREEVVFRFNVTDFGGETSRPNSITKELNISTGNISHIGISNLK